MKTVVGRLDFDKQR